MKTYISILRGINVGGNKSIKMEALRDMCESLGFKNVKTYIQSGNIIFHYKNSNIENLETLIQQAIAKQFQFDVPVIVREANDLQFLLSNNPFLNKRKEDIKNLHVTFLSQEPSSSDIKSITHQQFMPDEFIVNKNIVYVFCPNGYGNTKLNNNFFENKLKVKATTRNWKTVMELAKLSESNA